MTEILTIYLVGSTIALTLSLLNWITALGIAWLTKTNILVKNLLKLKQPNNKSFLIKFLIVIGSWILLFLSSWIEVIHQLWLFIKLITQTLRVFFNPLPETIKNLTFPLKNNPYLERETVWAYSFAINLALGKKIEFDQFGGTFAFEIDEITEFYPTFNIELALKQLQSLIKNTPREQEIVKAIDFYKSYKTTFFSINC